MIPRSVKHMQRFDPVRIRAVVDDVIPGYKLKRFDSSLRSPLSLRTFVPLEATNRVPHHVADIRLFAVFNLDPNEPGHMWQQ